MSSNRPYLLRAIYDWISDNGLTPYLLVDAAVEGVQVPPQAVRNGQVVLNLAMRAVADLDLGNEWITFQARFSGVSHVLRIPVRAVRALYAQENGQGMMFPADDEPPPPSPPAEDQGGDRPPRGSPRLRVVK
ncbi:ClpXP protease specificity-enhancing factor [Aerosticca soli]|nr:ClpXP protease specificity-enhancing factor [Aerosticca soli]MDI3262453.1 ClpXP protease specificity-enhancing factor [Fulvimonas sp.]